jgi:hypothetical protein
VRATSFVEDSGSEERSFTGRADYRHELGAGLRGLVAERTPIEVAAEIVNTEFAMNSLPMGIRVHNNGWRSFGLRTRARVPCSAAVNLTPVVDFWRDDRLTFAGVLPDAAHSDAWQVRGGCGVEADLSPTRTLVVSAEYRRGKEDLLGTAVQSHYSLSERTYFAIHWRIGLETRVRRWLQVRLGAEYRRVDERVNRRRDFEWDRYIDSSESGSVRIETPLTLGCTATAGDLFLDLALADGAPSSATYLRAENGLADDAHLLAATIGWRF